MKHAPWNYLSPEDPNYPHGLVKLWRDLVKCGGTFSTRPACQRCTTGTYRLDARGNPRCDECGHKRPTP
jgi:hypothetical protein